MLNVCEKVINDKKRGQAALCERCMGVNKDIKVPYYLRSRF